MRHLKIERPIVFFDLETTGLDFQNDRIIEIAGVRIEHHKGEEVRSFADFRYLVNPGMPIPSEITELTGITNEDVKDAPTFKEIVGKLEDIFFLADLGGYSVARFDAKFLAAEFSRAGADLRMDGRRIVDARVIYHQKEKRDLTAALKFYCDEDTHGENHRAEYDANASVRILNAQLNTYPDLPDTVAELAAVCLEDGGRFVDKEQKLYWRNGEAAFNFGKHRSKTLSWVAKNDPGYLRWILNSSKEFSKEFLGLIEDTTWGKLPEKPAKATPVVAPA